MTAGLVCLSTPFVAVVDLSYLGPPFGWDTEHRARLRAELDAWIARLYGLTRDDLRYIVSAVLRPL
jgi:hypothetical protein